MDNNFDLVYLDLNNIGIIFSFYSNSYISFMDPFLVGISFIIIWSLLFYWNSKQISFRAKISNNNWDLFIMLDRFDRGLLFIAKKEQK